MTELLYVACAVFALAFASMAAYAVVRPNRDADGSRKGTRFLLCIGDFLLHWFLASGVALGLGHLEVGGWAIAAGGLCDVLDGRIARRRGLASAYGKFIDSSLDRYAEVSAFLGLVVYFGDRPSGAFLAAATLAGSLLVSYVQARGETVRVAGAGGLMQRAERLVATFLICIADPPVCAWRGWTPGTVVLGGLTLLAPAIFGTAIYRTVWTARRLRDL